MWKTTKYPYLSNIKLTFVGFNITKTPLTVAYDALFNTYLLKSLSFDKYEGIIKRKFIQ